MLKSLSTLCLLTLVSWAHAQDHLALTRSGSDAASGQTLLIPVAADGTFSYVSPIYATHAVADGETSERVRIGYEISGTVTTQDGGLRTIAITTSHAQVTDWLRSPSEPRFLPTVEKTTVKTTIRTRPGTENILNAALLKVHGDGRQLGVHETITLLDEQGFAHW